MIQNKIQIEIILSFFVLIIFSVINIFGQNTQANKKQLNPCIQSNIKHMGLTVDNLAMDSPPVSTVKSEPKIYPVGTKPLRIISKPQPKYTDEAEQNCVAGTVKLKVTFFADGKVGNIRILKGLDYGLSNRAVEAAKLIKFEPKFKNNKPKTVTTKITYNFTIY